MKRNTTRFLFDASPTDCTARHWPAFWAPTCFREVRAGEPAPDLRSETEAAPLSLPRAKSVIQLFMNGGPSQVDLFDPKPTLKRLAGTAPSRELSFAISNGKAPGTLMPSPFEFKRHGKCGMEISDALPHIADVRRRHRADPLHVRRARQPRTRAVPDAHRPDRLQPAVDGRVGGLRTRHGESEACRRTWCLTIPRACPINGISNWQSAWLPPIYQGTRFRAEGAPVLNLEPRPEMPAPLVEAERNLLRKLDAAHREQRPYQPELDARISSYELAARMQLAASYALDVSQESRSDARSLRLERPGDRLLWQALPDGPPAGGAWRALRSVVHRKPDFRLAWRPAGRPATTLAARLTSRSRR